MSNAIMSILGLLAGGVLLAGTSPVLADDHRLWREQVPQSSISLVRAQHQIDAPRGGDYLLWREQVDTRTDGIYSFAVSGSPRSAQLLWREQIDTGRNPGRRTGAPERRRNDAVGGRRAIIAQ